MALTMDQMGQDPAYESFLYATLGEDMSGINVSVISMLARLEIDPWIEASSLAAMEDGEARKMLNTLIVRFKDVPILGPDQGRIISALLDLLPRKKGSANSHPPDAADGLPALATRVPFFWYIITFLVLGWISNLAQGQ